MLQIYATKHFTLGSSCSYAIYVHHWGEDDLESLRLIFHFRKLGSSWDCHLLPLYTSQNKFLLVDGQSSS